MTSSRRSSAKSMSISGIWMRSGFRNRSNVEPVLHRVQVRDAQAVQDDAARRRAARAARDARWRAQSTKSQTNRMYAAKPVFSTTSSSYRSRCAVRFGEPCAVAPCQPLLARSASETPAASDRAGSGGRAPGSSADRTPAAGRTARRSPPCCAARPGAWPNSCHISSGDFR